MVWWCGTRGSIARPSSVPCSRHAREGLLHPADAHADGRVTPAAFAITRPYRPWGDPIPSCVGRSLACRQATLVNGLNS